MDRNSGVDIEKALFEAFIVPRKKRRYVELVGTKRGREKIRLSLDHFADLDPRFCHRINPSEHLLPSILKKLKDLGAPSECYVASSDAELDGQEMDLTQALKDVVGRGMGTFLSCLTGRLAYFESEERNERYICFVPSRAGVGTEELNNRITE